MRMAHSMPCSPLSDQSDQSDHCAPKRLVCRFSTNRLCHFFSTFFIKSLEKYP